ncbi:molybdate ABC transporter substrate-binding protein [Dictyobacter aurantiacus]|uniref:Molybdenum ABC transporter substrate-binding protein n=1 Tax=Dictyobacter aurantiacus TaxID=1936993 RepID=A0A401ZGV4_9CHLR|nr:molybdate ABC transporter substrate-binding protein [Dictyobacter aurantiacus]GCE06115.1 molybdenum ABC transporter substrate-binding protein [Dictyobacter aurantiacus]
MKRVHSTVCALLLLTFLLAACGGGNSNTGSTQASTATKPAAANISLQVFAAASLTESFHDIAKQYQARHPNVSIKYNFNGSQLLEQQIANGAPADVFASADQTNMKKASAASVVESAQIFAQNRLVVIVPTGNKNVTGLKDLAKSGVKIDIGAAAVPAGKYSQQVLDKMGASPQYGADYEASVKKNIVSQEENVKAVVQKVQLGEVDAGFVYRTDVTNAVSAKVTVIDIPDTFNVIAQYPIAVTKNAPHHNEAQDFVNYVLSSDGQAVLQKYHFIAAPGK